MIIRGLAAGVLALSVSGCSYFTGTDPYFQFSARSSASVAGPLEADDDSRGTVPDDSGNGGNSNAGGGGSGNGNGGSGGTPAPTNPPATDPNDDGSDARMAAKDAAKKAEGLASRLEARAQTFATDNPRREWAEARAAAARADAASKRQVADQLVSDWRAKRGAGQ